MVEEQTVPSEKRAKLLSRAVGCLQGLAVGDAFGDLGRSQDHRLRYGIISELYSGAKSTDDTEFAVLTAQTLIDCGGELTHEALLTAWDKYILQQGGMFERGGKPLYGAVANLQRGILPPLSGSDNVQNNDDGAAMRIAPVGILCAGDPQRAASLAALDAQMSHAGDGIWAAQAVAASVAVAMAGAGVEAIIDAGRAVIPTDSWLARAMGRALSICEAYSDLFAALEQLHVQLWTPVHSMAAEAVPQAYALFRLTNGDFRQGMIWSGNFGRDADTISAIVGALSGALHGESVIPPHWAAMVDTPAGVCLKFAAQKSMRQLAGQLVALIS
ncbi:MAG: ADP-ribosylglycohydrolase family protein [Anaerolineae bacterium]|nr:ADP-ribosylglycohydrolase family protein [Anaerolineae bacterium]NUQ03694.1 ADP-ribosylglycohydrolase family protein [Anaerolineae bacterium]